MRILAPLLIPGILASSILVVVRTVGMFELMSAAGIRAQQSVDAMAVIYCTMMLTLLVVALRFVNPAQLVARVKEDSE